MLKFKNQKVQKMMNRFLFLINNQIKINCCNSLVVTMILKEIRIQIRKVIKKQMIFQKKRILNKVVKVKRKVKNHRKFNMMILNKQITKNNHKNSKPTRNYKI